MRYDPSRRKSEDIQTMFSSIARKYDLLNHLLSLNFDKSWRKRGVKKFSFKENELYLDLCSGTGDFGNELKTNYNVNIIGVDFSIEMIKIAKKKYENIFYIVGDALNLPFKDESIYGIMVGFGIRNFENLKKGLLEINRVLKKDGEVVIIEFPHKVRGLFGFFFNFYFKKILPFLGKLISKDDSAYRYLPLSTRYFPDDEDFLRLLKECNFNVVSFEKRTFNIIFEVKLQKR